MADIANATTEAEEREITPEMIEAGCRAIAGYNYHYDLESDIVVKIYQAMVMAKYQGLSVGLLFDWRVPEVEAWTKALEMNGYNVLSEMNALPESQEFPRSGSENI